MIQHLYNSSILRRLVQLFYTVMVPVLPSLQRSVFCLRSQPTNQSSAPYQSNPLNPLGLT